MAVRLVEGKVVNSGMKVGIVCARFNEFITGKLLEGALDALRRPDEAERYMLRALENQKQRPGDLDLAVTYVNLAQHYAAQNDTDARIAACLDKAMERMDSPDAVWEYYYAHTARKIAPALEALGRADAARDLRERADIIYEGT